MPFLTPQISLQVNVSCTRPPLLPPCTPLRRAGGSESCVFFLQMALHLELSIDLDEPESMEALSMSGSWVGAGGSGTGGDFSAGSRSTRMSSSNSGGNHIMSTGSGLGSRDSKSSSWGFGSGAGGGGGPTWLRRNSTGVLSRSSRGAARPRTSSEHQPQPAAAGEGGG